MISIAKISIEHLLLVASKTVKNVIVALIHALQTMILLADVLLQELNVIILFLGVTTHHLIANLQMVITTLPLTIVASKIVSAQLPLALPQLTQRQHHPHHQILRQLKHQILRQLKHQILHQLKHLYMVAWILATEENTEIMMQMLSMMMVINALAQTMVAEMMGQEVLNIALQITIQV